MRRIKNSPFLFRIYKIKYRIVKFIREQLYEKFEEQSDPIKDMGIGQYNINFGRKLKQINRKVKIEKLKFFKTLYGKTIEGYFGHNGEYKIRKFKLKSIEETHITDVYDFISENDMTYRLYNNGEIKILG